MRTNKKEEVLYFSNELTNPLRIFYHLNDLSHLCNNPSKTLEPLLAWKKQLFT